MKKEFKGYTFIEMTTTLVISSIISLAIYFVFTNSSKDINNEEMLLDIKNYTSTALEIISEKIRSADEINISSALGSITIKTSASGQDETFIYNVVNNLIYENSQPLKIYGDYWLTNDEDNYDLTLTMTYEQGLNDIFASSEPRVNDNMYTVNINIFIESDLNNNYEDRYKGSSSVIALNKLVQTPGEES